MLHLKVLSNAVQVVTYWSLVFVYNAITISLDFLEFYVFLILRTVDFFWSEGQWNTLIVEL